MAGPEYETRNLHGRLYQAFSAQYEINLEPVDEVGLLKICQASRSTH